jgi:uncharacterized membrane protein YagU involved in acid resistance
LAPARLAERGRRPGEDESWKGEAMQTLARGALAGLAATVPMTVVIGAGRAAGLMGTPPPVEITENVGEHAGEQPDRQSPEFQAAWLAAHAGYGAACGVLFAAIRPLLPRSDLVAGLLFGGAVWGVSYIGVMPSLNLYPSAKDDSNQRQAVMIAAHAVFGTALATVERYLRSNEHQDLVNR